MSKIRVYFTSLEIQSMGRDEKIKKLHHPERFEGAFEEVYVEYFKPLYLYARTITKSEDLAKDVVSDVFFNLWKSQSDFSKIKELKAYLFVSVKNHAIRSLAKDPRDFIGFDQENHIKEIERVNPEEILLEKELFLAIEETVSRLPDQCQLIFRMAKNQQLSYKEIAEELMISQSTVKTQVSRAVSAIRQAITERYEEEGSSESHGLGYGGMLLLVSLLLGV